jgi:hypothetical protein
MINYSDYLDYVSQNPWLNVVSTAFGLIGIILAIIFYIKSKKIRQPIYRTRSINLVKENTSKIKSVSILYNENRINNLSVAKIAIWNAGKETINSTDVAKKDKFRIEIDDGYEILDYELLYQKNPINDFKLTKISDKILEIDFDYFDKDEGIIIQIYHTATTEDSLNVKGTLKGGKNIIRNDSGKKAFTIFDKIDKILDFLQLDYILKKIPAFFFFLIPILLIIHSIFTEETKNTNTIVLIFANTIIFVLYWLLGYVIMKNKMPKGFDLFENEF